MHRRFFPKYSEEELLRRALAVMDEYGAYIDIATVDIRRLMYYSNHVVSERKRKASAAHAAQPMQSRRGKR